MEKRILESWTCGSLANGEMGWSTDASEKDQPFSCKKQAAESASKEPTAEAANNLSTSESSGQKCNFLIRPTPIGLSNLSAPRPDEKDPSLYLNTGTEARKVKVREVVPENQPSEVVRKSYNPEDGSVILANTSLAKIDGNFLSLRPASNKGDGLNIPLGNHFSGIDNSLLSIGQAFNRRNYSFAPFDNLMSISPSYYKNQANSWSRGPIYDMRGFASAHGPHAASFASLGAVYSRRTSNINLGTPQNQSLKNGATLTAFSGLQDKPSENSPSARLNSNLDVLLPNQSSTEPSGSSGQRDFMNNPSSDVVSKSAGSSPKNKERKRTKRVPSNRFPANVKALLSTGILDGVPVKYVSWSREKNLRGVVKSTGYLCGCKECKLSRVINAFEFERHAGCKTRHPNSNIYFENGKTIYAVVQELKSTPGDKLFEAIERATGSPVNQNNFITWKASFQAADQQVQRIQGKDEVVVSS